MHHHLRNLVVCSLCALFASCAWGYAGEEGKVVTEPQAEQNPQVVELEQNEESATSKTDTKNTEPSEPPPEASEPQSPCGVPTFTIERYTPEHRVIKTIDCVERKVVNVKRTPMGNSQLEEARAAGYPEDTWYLLVDPKGLRAKYLSNAELIKLSKRFDVEYVTKDRQHNLLIYEYRDAVR